MPLVNCKIDLELTWNKNCVLCSNVTSNNNRVTFMITDTKLYVPIVTLSTKDNTNLTKQLNEGFKRTVYWNQYQTKIRSETANANDPIRRVLDASFQGVNTDTAAPNANRVEQDSYRKYFMPRVDITKCNVLIDGRNFDYQPINSQIRKYDEIRKIATGKGDNYATGCLLDYDYFKKSYQLIAVDLSKRREHQAEPFSKLN